MPQSPALLDSTILDNVLFGRPTGAEGSGATLELSQQDVDVAERLGLGTVCRLKALEMTPGQAPHQGDLAARVVEMRGAMRGSLSQGCSVPVLPFEEGHSDPRHWVLECLIGGRCERSRCAAILLDRASRRELKPLLQRQLGTDLVEFGRGVLRESQQLLRIANFNAYRQLAAFPTEEGPWRLRSSSVGLAERTAPSLQEALTLCAIGLTSSPAELASDALSNRWTLPGAEHDFAAEVRLLRDLFAGAFQPFRREAIHPHLTWRENLVFGVADIRNSRTGRLVDEAILTFVEQVGLRDAFTRLGLQFGIGRLGANLSGGQGQMVALCRALLRRTPVLILDEPTSSLDPASRDRIAALLRDWKTDRIVITVSHDAELVRRSDRVVVMDGGRLMASGTPGELEGASEILRRTLDHR
jgi:ABC-type polar amino acid transport system ATPase subunit